MRVKFFSFFVAVILVALFSGSGVAQAGIQASENFDSTNLWGALPMSGYTNTLTNLTGWVINNAAIQTNNASNGGDTNTTPSAPDVVRLNGTASNSFVSTPWLTNGIGSIVFSARLLAVAQPNQLVLEGSSGDGNWTGLGLTNSITTNTWTSFTNSIYSSSNQFIRLRKLTFSAAQYSVFFDNILCTPNPACVAITNINLNPGYPSVGQSVRVSCDVLSLNPVYPAFSIP